MTCMTEAKASTAAFDAKTNDLAKNWRPASDNFAVTDVDAIVQSVFTTMRQAGASVDQAIGGLQQEGPRADLTETRTKLFNLMGGNTGRNSAQTFIDAVNAARAAKIAVINAPGLKDWVIHSLNASSSACEVVYYINCNSPWWLSALQTFKRYFDLAVAIIKKVVSVIVTVATTVLKVPDAVGTVLKWAPWVVLAAAGAYLFASKRKNPQRRRR